MYILALNPALAQTPREGGVARRPPYRRRVSGLEDVLPLRSIRPSFDCPMSQISVYNSFAIGNLLFSPQESEIMLGFALPPTRSLSPVRLTTVFPQAIVFNDENENSFCLRLDNRILI